MAGTDSRRGTFRRSAIWAGVAACAAILWVAPRADAAWSPAVKVAQQHDVDAPLVVLDRAGDAVFLWRGNKDVIYTRTRSANGTFSAIKPIARSVTGGYDVAVDSQGNAYYAWVVPGDHGERARARVRYADGTFSRVQQIASVPDRGERIGDPTVKADASGGAVFGWVSERLVDGSVLENNLIQTRSRSASGKLGSVRTVVRDRRQFDMGVDGRGNATFVWDKPAKGGVAEFTRVVAANGDRGRVHRISLPGSKPTSPQVAVTPSGRAIFDWSVYGEDSGTITLVSRVRSRTGHFKRTRILSRFAGDYANMHADLAVAPSGDAVFCWWDLGAPHGRTMARDGALGPVRRIAAKTSSGGCHPGIDSRGNATFAWDAQQGGKNRIFARSEGAAGHLGAARALSPAGYNAYFPDLAQSPAGDAAVAWHEGGDRGFAIEASFGP